MGRQVEFRNLTVRLKDRILFNDLNFEISDGDRFIFLGPNGVGKSLLLELICLGNSRELASRYKGLSVTGEILDSAGNDLLNPGKVRKIAYVSQNEDFYTNKTVKEICQTSCYGIGVDLDEDKLDHLLKAFEIYEKKNQKIKNNLSYGEGKILHIISRVLKLKATNLLLLDEPLNHLSFRNSKIFNDIILDEIKTNPDLSILMVSHCRAMSFAEKAMIYSTSDMGIKFKTYKPYDCFDNMECVQ